MLLLFYFIVISIIMHSFARCGDTVPNGMCSCIFTYPLSTIRAFYPLQPLSVREESDQQRTLTLVGVSPSSSINSYLALYLSSQTIDDDRSARREVNLTFFCAVVLLNLRCKNVFCFLHCWAVFSGRSITTCTLFLFCF